jgi:hypothetical protein
MEDLRMNRTFSLLALLLTFSIAQGGGVEGGYHFR